MTAVSTAWPLLGSLAAHQAALYLFPKHLLCWKYSRGCSHWERFFEINMKRFAV